MEKFIVFDGLRFCRDEKTGYYLCSKHGDNRRLHRYVYEFYNGKIPKGFDVHHVDGNKENNDISNLVLLKPGEHMKLHMGQLTEERKQRMRDNLTINARPKASEWHGSEEGRKWHLEHYEKMKEALYRKSTRICKNCGKQFDSRREGFCSNACKSAYRRKMGFDDEIRKCVICGEKFVVNRYAKTKTCGQNCAARLRVILKEIKKTV